MVDLIIAAALALILGGAIRYIYKEKKRGAACVGCSCCSKGCSGGCCGSNSK